MMPEATSKDISSSRPAPEDTPELFDAILLSPVPCLVISRPGASIRECNEPAARLLGYQAERLAGTPFIGLCDDEDGDARELAGMLAGGAPFYNEPLTLRRADGGTVRLALSSIAPRTGSLSLLMLVEPEPEQAFLRERLESLWSLTRMTEAGAGELRDHILNQIVAMTGSRYGFYSLLDREEKELTFCSWSREVMDECRLGEREFTFTAEGHGLLTEALRRRETVIFNDVGSESLLEGKLPEGHVPLMRFMAVPIFSREHIIALAAVANKETDYTVDDARHVSAFVTSAQVILQKREAETALRHNHDIHAAISAILRHSMEDISTGDLMRKSLDLIFAIPWLGLKHAGSIFIAYSGEDRLEMIGHAGLPPEAVEACENLSPDDCLCGQAACEGRLKFADHSGELREPSCLGVAPHRHYCIPMRAIGDTVGVVNLFTDTGYELGHDETRLLASYADAMAGIFERRLADQALSLSECYNRSLLRIAKAMERARDHLDILKAVNIEVRDMLGYNSTWLALTDPGLREVDIISIEGRLSDIYADEEISKKVTHFQIEGDPLLEEIVTERKPVIVEEAIDDPRFNREVVRALGNRSMVDIPVELMDGSLAILNTGTFGDEGVKVPTGEQVAYLSSIASQISVVLDRFRIREARREAEEKLQRQYETQKAIGAILRLALQDISMEDLLDRSLRLLFSIPWLGVESKGAVFLADEEGEHLDLVAEVGFTEPIIASCSRIPFGWCLCGRAAREDRLQFAGDIDERHDITYSDITPHGHYCIPLDSADRLIGVITLYLEAGHRRNEEEEAFLVSVADALAGVIERKRAQEELALSERYTKSLLRFAKSVEQARKPEDLVKAAYPEVEEMLGFRSTWLGFINEDLETARMMALMGNIDNFVEFDAEYRIKGDPWLEEMAAARGPVFMEDARTDPRSDKEIIARDGYRTMLCMPIRLMDDSLVVLCTGTFGDEGVRVPTDEQVEYFSSLASSIAVVLDRFRFLEDRERAQEELRKSEEKYRTLFEESQDTVFITTADGRFTDINQAGLELFGFPSKEEFMSADVDEDLGISPDEFHGIMELVARQGFVKDHELTINRRDGRELIVFVTANALLDAEGSITAIRGIMRDMTEYRRLEDQLVQSQKMESIGRLAGGIAHDFNNYLTAIEGYADLALSAIPEGSQAHEDLLESRRSADRASDLTRQLLLFSRRESINRRELDLNRVINDLLTMLKRLIGENYVLRTDLEEDAWPAYADSGHIEQVIMNLVVNARDAMPDGGEITISTRNRRISEDIAAVNPDASPGAFACLSVRDAGVGMDAETITHIFEPFFSTKESGKGTGLGLSVVHGIVMQHGGWIDVESSPGRGSTFNIYIPAVAEKAASREEKPAPSVEVSGAGERILVVEDQESVRTLARRMLASSGYSVTVAGNATEAMDIFRRENGDFSLVFSDFVLPDIDGLELVGRLRELKPDLKVLLSSGYSNEMDWDRINRLGYPFISKPYILTELRRKIHEVLQS